MMSILRSFARRFVVDTTEDPEAARRRDELLKARNRERNEYRASIARLDAANHFLDRGDLVRSWEEASSVLKGKGHYDQPLP